MTMIRKILITGGAGFIVLHVWSEISYVKKYPNYKVFNLDSLSYAGNLTYRILNNIQTTSLLKVIFEITNSSKRYFMKLGLMQLFI